MLITVRLIPIPEILSFRHVQYPHSYESSSLGMWLWLISSTRHGLINSNNSNNKDYMFQDNSDSNCYIFIYSRASIERHFSIGWKCGTV